MDYHLAQLNLARAKYPLDDPRMKGFVDKIPEVNKIGENSPGFVWILKDDSETAVNFRMFNDPYLLVNMTVWEDLEALKAFAYNGEHLKIFLQRKEWFIPMEKEHLALWWIPTGHIPTIQEAEEKIKQLWDEGPSQAVFSFRKIFAPPTSAEIIEK